MLFNLFIALLILINILCMYIFFIEPHALEVNALTLPLAPEKNVYKGMKIVHLSDPHIDTFGRYEKKVIQKTNDTDADFIFITGDLIAYNQDFAPAVTFLNKLKARQGIYVVFGNSDYTYMTSFFRAIKNEPLKKGIFILRNDIVNDTFNGAPLLIAGLDDPITGYARPELLPDFSKIKGFNILLAHAYTTIVRNKIAGVDLVLTGHTHGGQINVLPRRLIKKWRTMTDKILFMFIDGFQQDGSSWVNVSRGIGMSYLPIRFRCRPEISVITLVTS